VHDARTGEHEGAARVEVLDGDRGARTGGLADARDRAERAYAAEGLGEGGAADAVVGHVDAAASGERAHLGDEVGVASDDDVVGTAGGCEGGFVGGADGGDDGGAAQLGPPGGAATRLSMELDRTLTPAL
jgi:hypothetical protein